jgi:hypothetical protein
MTMAQTQILAQHARRERKVEAEIRLAYLRIQQGVERWHEFPQAHSVAGLRWELGQLEGLIMAWCYQTGRWMSAGPIPDERMIDSALEIPRGSGDVIDLARLREEIEASPDPARDDMVTVVAALLSAAIYPASYVYQPGHRQAAERLAGSLGIPIG